MTTEEVTIKTDCQERVAYEIAQKIAGTTHLGWNKSTSEAQTDYKDKFLDLYAECLQAVKGIRN